MAQSPNIRIAGIRKSIPSGYVLGRVDPATGDVQLIPLAELGTRLIASGGVGAAGVVELVQGTTITQGVVEIGPLLVLSGQTLEGQVWAPMVNGDPPGDALVGHPDGQIKGPTILGLPNGACMMVRVK